MSIESIHNDLTIIILAGGKSSRMGKEKGFLRIGVDSFASKLIEVAKSVSSKVFISVAKANKELYSNFKMPLIEDELDDKGPLGGIVAALNEVKTPWFVVLSIDTPLVTKATIEGLWQQREKKEGVLYQVNGKAHPLVALYHIHTKELWQEALIMNKLKITSLVESFDLNVLELNIDRVKELKNINTPQEYKAEFTQ